MFPHRYFAQRYFTNRYFPQFEGAGPAPAGFVIRARRRRAHGYSRWSNRVYTTFASLFSSMSVA